MKKTLTIIISLVTTLNYAQLKDCSQCDTVQYTPVDIANNSIYELNVLRNEIYARHQYVFENERLRLYFRKKPWYKPNYSNPAKVTLNKTEEYNITLFKTRQAEIEAERKVLFKELKTLKSALNTKDLQTAKSFVAKEVKALEDLNSLTELKEILNAIDLEDVNWYKDKALYQVKIDNGFIVRETHLYIEGSKVTLSTADQQHSSIMDEPFAYGSDYHSEDEFNSWWIFSFDGKKLTLKERQMAG
ncbi:YARHG domain-containing protein [Aquimarina sp. MMG016]|uniref:YARHG domain-containing protein n=1 Tax=Aquimarina sp. MMG016 TaxID=2822690 RepID=UPI001B3A16F8|nr:YARHG domain-containing protein [Aquimarina sp. MMG016]MBQ4819600.1 YARHG domain-containing protein [Aquimarina sp. MMG016]